jgi:hypothetical protein
MHDRGRETDHSIFTMTPAPNNRRGGSQTRPLFRPLVRSRTPQTHPHHASND